MLGDTFVDRFRCQVRQYLNFGYLSGFQKRVSLLSYEIPILYNRRRLLRDFKEESRSLQRNFDRSLVATIGYQGDSPSVQRIARALHTYLSDDLIGAWVHGSIATGEEVSYSDFDGLLILRDEVFSSGRRLQAVARSLGKIWPSLIDIDPLQHHGWFVLLESDLLDYPQTYFPYELFREAKSILPADGRELVLAFDEDRQDYSKPLLAMIHSLKRQLIDQWPPGNMYVFKGFLSRLMLLPTLYCQFRQQAGVFKRESFEMARVDFSRTLWEPIEVASAIRMDWSVELPEAVEWLRKNPGYRSLWAGIHFAPKVPPPLLGLFDRRLISLTLELLNSMGTCINSRSTGRVGILS